MGKPVRESPSTSGGLKLLQMVLESDIGRCASEDAGPPRGVDYEIPHWLEGNEALLIGVLKSLPNRRVMKKSKRENLKTLRGSLEGKAQRGQYLDEYRFRCVTLKDAF